MNIDSFLLAFKSNNPNVFDPYKLNKVSKTYLKWFTLNERCEEFVFCEGMQPYFFDKINVNRLILRLKVARPFTISNQGWM